jgi:hypothetical protein
MISRMVGGWWVRVRRRAWYLRNCLCAQRGRVMESRKEPNVRARTGKSNLRVEEGARIVTSGFGERQ